MLKIVRFNQIFATKKLLSNKMAEHQTIAGLKRKHIEEEAVVKKTRGCGVQETEYEGGPGQETGDMTQSKIKCQEDLEEMRDNLHSYFDVVVPQLTEVLLEYAEKLDKAYKKIKISKIAGATGGIVGGVFSGIGFGLSFFTFGASLGLVVAGGIIGGAGGLTAGGATIAEFVEARKARNKAKEKLEIYDKATKEIFTKCSEVAMELEHFGTIEKAFPSWFRFWKSLVFGSGQTAVGVGWSMIASTIINGVRIAKGADIAGDIGSAAVRIARPAGNVARGFHIAGGVISMVFIPIDLYSLVSNSRELHTGEAHNDSKRIREIVKRIESKHKDARKIDGMINDSIFALKQ